MDCRLIAFLLYCSFVMKSEGIFQVDISNATKKHPVVLTCSNNTGSFTWTYDGKQEMKNETYKITESENVGEYDCSSVDVSASFKAVNFSKPSIEHTSKSIYATEGDTNLTLICHSYSSPVPMLSWIMRKEGADFNALEEILDVNLSNTPTENYIIKTDGMTSKLIIKEVTAESRANYVCNAQNDANSGQYSILVRVKSPLAPVYPIIGILVEILILAVIMLIVSRRNRQNEAAEAQARSLTGMSRGSLKEE